MWRNDVCHALALTFLFTASMHFTTTREDLIAMVPCQPRPWALVTFRGVCTPLGAIGLVIPATRTRPRVALVLLLAVSLPADIDAARGASVAHPSRDRPLTLPWLRVPTRAIFIRLTQWASLA